MATDRNDAPSHSDDQPLGLSEAHLQRSIQHYRQLLSDCLTHAEPSQKRMAPVYRVLEQERRALLMAVEDGCPERCLDYLDAVSKSQGR